MALNPELRGYNLGAALNSFDSHCQSFRSFGLIKRHLIILPPLIGSARPIVTLKLTLVYFGPIAPLCPNMAMSLGDTRRNASRLSHDSNSVC
jgi:hypothetical protein